MSRFNLLRGVAALLGLLASYLVSAHEVRPALLQITQQDAHRYTVLWKQPVTGELAIRLIPRLSSGALDKAPDVVSATPSFAIKLWRNVADDAAPLDGQTVTIEGLEQSITDVLVNVTLADGRSIQQLLNPKHTSAKLDLSTHAAPPAAAYLKLGVEHILTGVDHLLFVFGLMLLVPKSWSLLRTITAFTVAHSITLAATTLGWIRVPSAVIEALVALSIVILAVELVRNALGERGLTSRFPWLIAFVFGLLHGCAFAGALAEVGLPAHDIPFALLLFNVGVEIGQLLFIAAASLVLLGLARMIKVWPTWTRFAAPYAIGTFASYWFIERFLLALTPTALFPT